MNEPRAGFDQLLAELRPKLHRYCARMTGSVIDGEDVLQEALVKAIEAFPGRPDRRPEGWLFRIAHNAALDFLRRRARRECPCRRGSGHDRRPDSEIDRRQAAAASLRTFMRLPVAQRSSVILMDVLGYSLDEIARVIDTTVPAVKAALHRGRSRLRELAAEPDDRPPPALAAADGRALPPIPRASTPATSSPARSVGRRSKVEVVNRTRLNGRSEVGNYFTNYGRSSDWRLSPGWSNGGRRCWSTIPTIPTARRYTSSCSTGRGSACSMCGFPLRPLCPRRRRIDRFSLARVQPSPSSRLCDAMATLKPWHNAASSTGRYCHVQATRSIQCRRFDCRVVPRCSTGSVRRDGHVQGRPHAGRGSAADRQQGRWRPDRQLDTATKKLTYSATYKDLTGPAAAAHFHGPADAKTNAGVVVPVPAPASGGMVSPLKGEATLTDAQAADLAAGKWYFNVHTAANKGGEIRGQVMKGGM